MSVQISGIYRILNKINGKSYVGSAIDFVSRRCDHKKTLRKNKHHSILLQRAWNKYGEENFEFFIIEETKEKNRQAHVGKISPMKGKHFTRFCPKGHDKDIVGRNTQNRCRECGRLDWHIKKLKGV